jgi:hypothetical protein
MVACHLNFQFQILALSRKKQRSLVWLILLWMHLNACVENNMEKLKATIEETIVHACMEMAECEE